MEHEYIKLEHSNPQHKDWFVVNWCLGNTCNFSCSYCPIGLHDGSIKWPDDIQIKEFITRTIEQVSPRQVYFEFTGGEVTLYKHFSSICQHITSLGAKVGLISNGSRTLRWWNEHKKYFDHICLSYHPEFSDENHFIEVIKSVHNDLRTHVNIMMKPEIFDHCYAIANKIKDLGNISMALQPLIHDFGDTLYDYTDIQKRILDKQYDLITKFIKFNHRFEYYRGAMKTVQEDGTSVSLGTHRFIADKTNDWSGWKCSAGMEQIVIDMDGSIFRGWCKVGNKIGNIFDPTFIIPSNPIICNKTMCHCNFDIMTTKEK